MSPLVVRALVCAVFLVFVAGCDDSGGGDPPVPDASLDGGMLVDSELPVDLGPDGGEPVDVGEVDVGPVVDMGTSDRPPCDTMANLGLLAEPEALTDERSFAPRAVFTGTEFGVIWQSPRSADRNTVWFQRFDMDGGALGSAAEIGVASVPQHAVGFDGQNYVVAWLAARTDESIFDGVRLRSVGADGTPSVAVVDVSDSFDAEQIAFDWAPFGGGMVLYNRGRNGSSGVYANSVDEGMTVGPQQRLTASPAQSPAVVFGDGTWGASWLARDGEQPAELAFVVLNDAAMMVSDEEVRVRGGGIGSVYMAYGQGIYAAGWTRQGALGRPEATLSMFDGGGSPFAGTPLAGPEGVATVSDLTFVPPDRFVVAWQENRQGGTRVGVSRFDANGLQTAGLALSPPAGSARLGLAVGGMGSRLSVWFTEDPAPPAVGYSAEARVMSGVLAPCDR